MQWEIINEAAAGGAEIGRPTSMTGQIFRRWVPHRQHLNYNKVVKVRKYGVFTNLTFWNWIGVVELRGGVVREPCVREKIEKHEWNGMRKLRWQSALPTLSVLEHSSSLTLTFLWNSVATVAEFGKTRFK